MLLFKTYYSELLGWTITSPLPSEAIPTQIAAAAEEWLSSSEGREYAREEEVTGGEFDYADALLNTSREILARYDLHLDPSAYEIIELDAGEDLLPDELRDNHSE